MSNILRRFGIFQEKVLEASASPGAFRDFGSTHTYSTTKIKDYFDAYLNHDKVRGPIDDLTEQTVGDGYFTSVEMLTPKTKRSTAKEFIDEFGMFFNLDAKLVNLTRIMLIAGFCPVETKLVKGPVEKNSLKIVHPITIDNDPNKGIKAVNGVVTELHQKVAGVPNVIKGKDLAWFVHGQIGNDPRGTSEVRGILDILNTLNSATADVEKILKRYIGPLGIWKTRDSIEPIKRAVMEREQGQDIFLGNMRPEDVDNTNFPQFIQIDPRVPFWEFIEYLDHRVYSYFRASDLWYVRNATEASAKQMDAIVQRHVRAIQREVKRGVEGGWLNPLTDLNNLKEMPRINFGMEPTGVEDIQPAVILEKGLELGFVSQPQFNFLIDKLGFDLGDHQEEEEEEKPSEEELEKAREDYQEQYQEARHSRHLCMDCDKSPVVEVLWAEGRAHAWFCKEHFEYWRRREMTTFPDYTYGEDIVAMREVKWGVASENWSDGITKAEAHAYLKRVLQ